MNDFSERSHEELEARLAELTGIGENPEERSVEELEGLAEEREAIEAELETRRAAAEAEARKCEEAARSLKEPEKTFKESEERKMFEVESKEYRSAWLKHLQGRPLNEEERGAVTASAAIPTETLNKIYDKAEVYPLLSAIDVMHIPGNVSIPVATSLGAGAVVAMGSASTDSEDVLAAVNLGAKKLIKTVEITADVAAMSVDAFETWLVDRLANKIYRLVTKMVAAGRGTTTYGEPTGLSAVYTTTAYTYASTGITYANILDIIGNLPTEYLPNAQFVMSRENFFQGVLGIVDSAGAPITVADRQAPAKYNVLGFPVIVEDEIGENIVFGDLKEGYVWNFASDVKVDRDESVGFRTGSVCFRGMALGDGSPTGIGLIRYTKA